MWINKKKICEMVWEITIWYKYFFVLFNIFIPPNKCGIHPPCLRQYLFYCDLKKFPVDLFNSFKLLVPCLVVALKSLQLKDFYTITFCTLYICSLYTSNWWHGDIHCTKPFARSPRANTNTCLFCPHTSRENMVKEITE